MSSPELNRKVTGPDIYSRVISILLGVAIGLTIRRQHYPPVEFLCAYFASYPLGVILHEIGHGFAALAMGGTVEHVRLGQPIEGRKPWEIRFLGLDWTIHGFPLSGAVQSTLDTPENYRFRRCTIIASGPAANALMIAAGLLLAFTTSLSAEPVLMAMVVGCMFANSYLVISSLLPRMVRSGGQMLPNDGLNIIRTLQQSDDEVRQSIAGSLIARTLKHTTAAAAKMSTAELLAASEAEPEDLALLWHLTESLRANDDPRFPAHTVKLIAVPGMPDNIIASLIDSCVTWHLHQGPPEHPEFIDELSQRLLKLNDCVSTRGTRGSVLIDIGRIAEGKKMLWDVLAKTDSPVDKSYSHIFLALASESEGKIDAARELAKMAQEFDPTCPGLKRVANLLDSQPASDGHRPPLQLT